MASERLLIQIDEKGARVVDARMTKLGNTTQKTSSQMSKLKQIIAGVVSVVAIRNTIRLADAYTVIQNRLGFVVKEAEQLANVTARLFDISAKTRTSFESTAEVYTRVQLAAQDLGKSQVEVLNFSESLNQALILSGAGAQEARNGMIQLSQSLASGALRGDELRAVLEQIPVVADVIAKGMGVLRGDLRRMGAEGEISSTIILESFKKARQELADKFAKTVPTVSQALEVARSQMILWVAQLDRSLGITRTLSKWLIILSGNFDVLATAILSTAAALAILNFSAIAASIQKAATATSLFIGATNPLVAIAAVVVGIGTAMFFLSDKIKIASDSAATLSDVFTAIRNKFQPIIRDLRAMGEITSSVFKSMAPNISISLKGTVLAVSRFVDGVIGLILTLAGSIKELVIFMAKEFRDFSIKLDNFLHPFRDEVPLMETDTFADLGERLAAQISIGMSRAPLTNMMNKLFDEADAIAEQRIKAQEEAAKKNKLSEAEGINKVATAEAKRALDDLMESTFSGAKAQEEYVEGQVILANAFGAGVITADEFVNSMTALQLKTQDAREPFEKLNRELAFQESLLGKTSQEIEVANSLRELSVDLLEHEIIVEGELKDTLQAKLEVMQHVNEVQAMQATILEDINGPMEEFRLAQEAVNMLLDQQAISAEQAGVALQDYRLAALENSASLADQIEAINLRVLKSIGTQAQAVAKGIEGVYGSLSRVTSEFLKTGKVDFKAWGREIIGILLKVIIQLLVVKAMQAATGMGGAVGSIAGGLAGALGQGAISATSGGANATGGRFLVGGGSGGVDQTQVAFRATAGERVTVERPDARGKFGSDAGGPVVVPAPQVTVVNVTDPDEIFSAIDSDEGEQRILNVISRNPGVIRGLSGGGGTVQGT